MTGFGRFLAPAVPAKGALAARGKTLEGSGKYLRDLGLRDDGFCSRLPVEKLVELKTDFRIAFRKNRLVGFALGPNSS
jgi:hypothetical protein